MILISSSGMQLLHNAIGSQATFLACGRNYRVVANYIKDRFNKIAILGAGTRGDFRREDLICCAWVAEILIAAGFAPTNQQTQEYVECWANASSHDFDGGNSAKYLKRSGQVHDLAYIINHVDDLTIVPEFIGSELIDVFSE